MKKALRAAVSLVASLTLAAGLVPAAAFAGSGSGVDEAGDTAGRSVAGYSMADAVAAAAGEADEADESSDALVTLSSDTVTASGTCGTVTWTLYDDGELVLAPTSGDEGTLESFDSESDVPWYDYRASITSVDVEGTVHAGESLGYMFYYCYNMVSADLSGLDTSNVTDMSDMFYECSSLTSLDLSGFDTSNVKGSSKYANNSLYRMFYGCESLTFLDLSSFDTSSATSMSRMFYDCESLASLDLSGFDTSNVTYMYEMFCGCESLTSLDLSSFDTSNVTKMYKMFYGCESLTSLDVSSFETSRVTDMYRMFCDCESLTSLDVSSFDTSNVTDMSGMFSSCSSLTSLDVTALDTPNVTTMYYMFSNCKSLTSLDVSSFDTSNVTYMGGMFYGCSSLTSLDVSGFDTSSVSGGWAGSRDWLGDYDEYYSGMGEMFYGCSSLTSLDLSGFDTSGVEDMSCMFYNCSSLTTVYVSELWSTESLITDADYFNGELSDEDDWGGDDLFSGCTSLVGGNGTAYSSDHVGSEYARIDTDGTPGYFTDKTAEPSDYAVTALRALASEAAELYAAWQAGSLSCSDEAASALAAAIDAAEGLLSDDAEGVTAGDVADCAIQLRAAIAAAESDAEGGDGSEDDSGDGSDADSAAVVTRLAGSNRYDTMAAIVEEAYEGETCDYAVLATGANFADALAAASLAGALDAPIVLVKPGDPSAAIEVLQGLGCTYAYVVGGTSAVSASDVEAIEEACGVRTQRLAGSNRRATALAVAEATDGLAAERSEVAIVTTGKEFADALSASPYSYWASAPIYLTKNDGTLDSATLAAIEEAGYDTVVVMGGTSAVTASAEAALEGIGADVVRLSGSNRYGTCVEVAEWSVGQGMTYDGAAVATGAAFPDALAGATLCGRAGSVMLLASDTRTAAVELLAENAADVAEVYLLGGESAVSANLAALVEAALA